ncbi:MAG: hypothetical protein ACYCO3_13540 [Mycobacteriales bacterium]
MTRCGVSTEGEQYERWFDEAIHSATPDHRTGVCIWEGESIEAVRELVEAVVGPYRSNEYFEFNVDGLP